MSKKELRSLWTVLKCGVATMPLAIAVAQMPASAQPKTQAQLEAEAAAARAAAATGADADDAAAAAQLFGGLTGTSKSTENTKDIVVTGTNIRGVAPTGTALTVVSKEDIQASGQTSVNQLLSTIPGFTTFNNPFGSQNTGAASQGGTQVSRPNLRGTPDGELGGSLGDPGSSTLILVDGNRQSAGGSRTQAVDPERISPSLLERVEVNTDGGSAAYGADAIGGVVNFVTKKRYNGAEASARLGYADDFWRYDANALIGKDWGSGSAYISANYAYNTPLHNKDRAYLMPLALADGLQTSVNCDLPNISIASTAASGTGTAFVPAVPTHYYRVNADGTIARQGDVIVNGVRTTAGTGTPVGGLATSLPAQGLPTDTSRPNLCTPSQYATPFNKNERYGASVSFFQKITDNIDFLLKGNYSSVDTYSIVTPVSLTSPVTANNPWRQELVNGANGTGTAQASYPTAQPGFPLPVSDVIRNGTAVTQNVLTNLGPVYGYSDNFSHNYSHTFGGSAELNWRIDGNWLLKATATYDRVSGRGGWGMNATSTLTQFQDQTGTLCAAEVAKFAAAGGNAAANNLNSPQNAAALAARAAARLKCINPYNPKASDPTLLAIAHQIDSKGQTHNAIIDPKINLDGALFEIPGGKVKIAVGAEYLQEDYETWAYASRLIPIAYKDLTTDPSISGTHGYRWIVSGYAEANIPLVSRANELTWIKELRVSLSARYDKIRFFGDTINPRIGASFKPTNWFTLRGNYNTSFRAPAVRLSVSAEGNPITITSPVGSAVPFNTSNPLIDSANQVIWTYNSGATKDLKPTRGTQWSVGIDLTPFRGFRASVTYGHIDYIDALNSPNIFALIGQRGIGQGCSESRFVTVLDPRTTQCTAAQIAAGLPSMVALTPAQVAAAKAAFLANATNADVVKADGRDVYGLYDTNFNNIGNSKIGNLDYNLSYNSRTPWGRVFVSVNGSVRLINKSQTSDTAPFVSSTFLNANSKHNMSARAGFTYGPLNASATLTRSDGYKVTRSATAPQDRVAAYNVIDFFATWDFKGDNVVEKGLQLSLGVNNILNTSPPVRYSGTPTVVGTANGNTLGRLVQLGFNKKF